MLPEIYSEIPDSQYLGISIIIRVPRQAYYKKEQFEIIRQQQRTNARIKGQNYMYSIVKLNKWCTVTHKFLINFVCKQ